MSAFYSIGDVRDPNRQWVPVPKPVTMKQAMRSAILNALAYTDGNQMQASRVLEMSQSGLRYAMARYGIPSATATDPEILNRRKRRKRES